MTTSPGGTAAFGRVCGRDGTCTESGDIYDSARAEGEHRLSASLPEQTATGFIAGVTFVFGIVALGMVRDLVAPDYASGLGQLFGALASGIGLVFVVVGRTELFTENFFDPGRRGARPPAPRGRRAAGPAVAPGARAQLRGRRGDGRGVQVSGGD